MSNSAFVYRTPETPEGHQHSYPQLVFGISGGMKIKIEGSTHEVVLDRMIGCAIPANRHHYFFGVGENKNITVNFTQPILDDRLARILGKPRFFLIDENMRKFIQFSANELPTYKGSSNIGKDRFSQNIVEIFKELLNDRIAEETDLPTSIDLMTIDQYLDRRLHKKITVPDLAKYMNTSTSHFFTLFRKEIGISPHQYLIKKRMEKANHLLKTTRMSIVEISQEVGFSSQSALNNTFKAQFGYTPGSVRRNIRRRL